MNRRLFCSVTLLLSLVLTANVLIAQDDPSPTLGETTTPENSPEPLRIGATAAPLDIEHWLSDGGGQFKPVTDFEGGKVYVIEFWATWCVPCIKGMPHLAELQAKYGDQSVQVIGISNEELGKVEAFLRRNYQPPESKAADSEPAPKTYAELTSPYCLVTDPDESVHNDYFRASGRRGIPCAFIVGKSGLIEWMGHPSDIDSPLKSVVNDSWDRVAFATEYVAEQKRDLMIARISKMVRTEPSEVAVKAIDLARNEFADDPLAMEKLDSMMAGIVMTPLYDSVDAGENVEALLHVEKLFPTVSKKVQRQLLALQIQLQLKESQFDEAAETLALVANEETFLAVELTRVARELYRHGKDSEEFPRELFVAGVALSQKAVDADGNNSYYLSTLARMQHAAGDLDAAIETQTKAVAKSDGRNKGYQVILDQLEAERDSNDESNDAESK